MGINVVKSQYEDELHIYYILKLMLTLVYLLLLVLVLRRCDYRITENRLYWMMDGTTYIILALNN